VTASTAEQVLETTYRTYRRVALVASFQAESGVLIDMAARLGVRPDVLTIDTGRLPAATYATIKEFTRRYDINLRLLRPDPSEVRELVAVHGSDLFRQSVQLRHSCCEVRKVHPLQHALRKYDAWVTGLRREESWSRASTMTIARDHAHGGIIKVAPLVDWSHAEVEDYLVRHDVPRHPLYAAGYTSIGCAPCTRATAPGEDERAGRWWWEQDSDKECGLHVAAAQEGI
jgi:phosphoadenosine phosphosulfate reductase